MSERISSTSPVVSDHVRAGAVSVAPVSPLAVAQTSDLTRGSPGARARARRQRPTAMSATLADQSPSTGGTPLVALRSTAGVAVVAATVLSSMVGFLDANVINVAVPAIGRDLHAAVSPLQW